MARLLVTGCALMLIGCPLAEDCPKDFVVVEETRFITAAEACAIVQKPLNAAGYYDCADVCGSAFNRCQLESAFLSAYPSVPGAKPEDRPPCPNAATVQVTCSVIDTQDELGSCARAP